ncbi:MAG TPA: ThuA domain-containing protein [Planctomycetota bacterium]|nr:ThuA domain-containing protein [Planctomycetota bacterium]
MELLKCLLGVATAMAAALGGETAKEPPPTWPWPGPTPPEIREALMKKRFSRRPAERELQQIEAAAPDKAPAAPAKPRRVLCYGRLWTHLANAFTEESVKIFGRKTGAFEVVAGDDPRLLLPESLKTFDALFLNGLHDPQPFLPLNWKTLPPDELAAAKKLDTEIKQSILAFVMEDGKGIAGIEGSIAALGDWKEFGEMMGAFYNGHYRGKHVYKVEEPKHPVAACLEGKDIELDDQSYLPGPPYSRKKVRVLLSLDLTKTPDPTTNEKQAWLKGHEKRQVDYTGREKDYAISWVRQHGKGRVFYCSLGVDWRTYLNPAFLRYLLAGIQFAIGDLPGDTTPSEK